jgi:hypothetical protein
MLRTLPIPCQTTVHSLRFRNDTSAKLRLLHGIAAAYVDESTTSHDAIAAFALAFLVGHERSVHRALTLMANYIPFQEVIDLGRASILYVVKPEVMSHTYGWEDNGHQHVSMFNIPYFIEDFVVPWSKGEDLVVLKTRS